MSLNAASLRLLADKGLTFEDVIELAEAMERRSDPTNAARQARHRAKKRNGVTVTHSNLPPNEEISIPPQLPSVISDEMTSPAVELKPEHVVEAWNATAQRLGLRAVRKFTPERRKKLATRIRQSTIDDFTEAIASIERSPFLLGENDRGWRADFDWMLEPKNFTKLIEGTYDR